MASIRSPRNQHILAGAYRELLEPVARFSGMRSVNHLEEEQIQRSAEALIRTHGSNAAMVCAQTAERWIKRGDPAAAELWTRFMHACRRLLDGAPQRPDV